MSEWMAEQISQKQRSKSYLKQQVTGSCWEQWLLMSSNDMAYERICKQTITPGLLLMFAKFVSYLKICSQKLKKIPNMLVHIFWLKNLICFVHSFKNTVLHFLTISTSHPMFTSWWNPMHAEVSWNFYAEHWQHHNITIL